MWQRGLRAAKFMSCFAWWPRAMKPWTSLNGPSPRRRSCPAEPAFRRDQQERCPHAGEGDRVNARERLAEAEHRQCQSNRRREILQETERRKPDTPRAGREHRERQRRDRAAQNQQRIGPEIGGRKRTAAADAPEQHQPEG